MAAAIVLWLSYELGILVRHEDDQPLHAAGGGNQIYFCNQREPKPAVHRVDVEFASDRGTATLRFEGRVIHMEFAYHFLFKDHFNGEGVSMTLDPEVYFRFDDGSVLGPCDPDPVFEAPT